MSDTESTALPPVGETYTNGERLERWYPAVEGVWVEGRQPDGSCLLVSQFTRAGTNHLRLSEHQARCLAHSLVKVDIPVETDRSAFSIFVTGRSDDGSCTLFARGPITLNLKREYAEALALEIAPWLEPSSRSGGGY